MEDAEIVFKIKGGDKTSFNLLIDRYGKQIYNTCYRFFLDKRDAEDISQEVFIEVFQSLRSFRGDAKFSTWIYRIAVTKCIDELRKRKRKKRMISIGKLIHIDEVASWLAGGVMPDKKVKDDDKFKEINLALNKLPDNQRVAFTLSKLEGYTNSEIGEIMDTTTIAVESLIYRAKKKISKDLETILKNNS